MAERRVRTYKYLSPGTRGVGTRHRVDPPSAAGAVRHFTHHSAFLLGLFAVDRPACGPSLPIARTGRAVAGPAMMMLMVRVRRCRIVAWKTGVRARPGRLGFWVGCADRGIVCTEKEEKMGINRGGRWDLGHVGSRSESPDHHRPRRRLLRPSPAR
ncbi:hypothetical protein BOTBODRAFT_579797, partial [Botryobasidium botryosum FD-172 SS1]